MPENTPPSNNIRRAHDAGFGPLVPLIPVGAQLFPGRRYPDGEQEKPLKLNPSSFGKVPGHYDGSSWAMRSGWTDYQLTEPDMITHDAADASVGLLTGSKFGMIDVDITNPDLAAVMWQVMAENFPDIQFRIGNPPKFAIPFRIAGGQPLGYSKVAFFKDGSDNKQAIEILGAGKQAVLLGVHPATQEPYRWENAKRQAVEPNAALCPTLTSTEIDALLTSSSNVASIFGWTADRRKTANKSDGEKAHLNGQTVSIDVAAGVMSHLPNNMDYDGWYRVGMALKYELGEDGWPLFDAWSRKSPLYNRGTDTLKMWKGLKPDGRITWGSIMHMVQETDTILPPELEAARMADLSKRNGKAALANLPAPAAALIPGSVAASAGAVAASAGAAAVDGELVTNIPQNAQDSVAMSLGVSGWNNRARYLVDRGHFLFWNCSFWELDLKKYSITLVRDFLRAKADGYETYLSEEWARLTDESKREKTLKWVRTMQKELMSNSYVMAVHTLMQSNAGTVVRIDDLNVDKMKLGTPDGTVDLRTGMLSPADLADLITKTTTVSPAAPGTAAPLWTAFLNRVMNNDPEMIGFLQRLCGYALTGRTTEHKFAFFYGGGRNGKGVFLNTVMSVMGAYSHKTPASVFLDSRNSEHPTSIAALHGARFVFGAEIPKGAFWNEALLKDMTGGDSITARFMRQDEFTFMPEFLLAIAGNNKPALRETSDAIRERMLLVPFTQYIPPEERDPDLTDKLMAEHPAILRWMIDGALMWQQQGLNAPDSVSEASKDYIDSEDFLGQFLDEFYVHEHLEKTEGVVVDEFYTHLNVWRISEGLRDIPKITLTKEMEQRGHYRRKMRVDEMTHEMSPKWCFDHIRKNPTKTMPVPSVPGLNL